MSRRTSSSSSSSSLTRTSITSSRQAKVSPQSTTAWRYESVRRQQRAPPWLQHQHRRREKQKQYTHVLSRVASQARHHHASTARRPSRALRLADVQRFQLRHCAPSAKREERRRLHGKWNLQLCSGRCNRAAGTQQWLSWVCWKVRLPKSPLNQYRHSLCVNP